MGKPEDEREFDDTTVTHGGAQAWSAVNPPMDGEPAISGDTPAEGYAGGSAPDSGAADTDASVVVDGSWSVAEPVQGPVTEIPADPAPGAAANQAPAAPQLEGKGRRRAGRVAKPDKAAKPSRAGRSKSEPVIPPGPVLVATGLGLLTANGWVFKDIDLTLRPSSVAAIVGPAGTGRSCLLLALSGRMAANTGTLTVAGHAMTDKPAAVRALTSVARISSLIAPEPGLTVRQSIDERCLSDDVDIRVGRLRFGEACAAMRVTFEPTALVGSMVGDQATLLSVALACVRVSALIVLDDLDRGVSTAVQQTMLDALIRLSKTGPTVVLSTTDRIPVMAADVVLDLTPAEGAAMWRLDAPLPGSQRLALDPMSEADRAVQGQLESGPDGPDDESGDPHARWRPDYPGDSDPAAAGADPVADAGSPGSDEPYGQSRPADQAGPYDQGPYDQGQFGQSVYDQRPDNQNPNDQGGPYDPGRPYDQGGAGGAGRPAGYQNQRDAPTEDPR